MENCFRCDRDGKEVKLLDAIYQNEIVRICEKCSIIESIPVIRKPTTSQLKESEKAYTVSQRLEMIKGDKKEERKRESVLDQIRKLDENPQLELPDKKSFNLVDNFHWEIARARRNGGLSPRQLAWALGESESAIKMIEKGDLPEDSQKLIRKLEQFFQIKIRERSEQEKEEEVRKLKEKKQFKMPRLEKEPEFDPIEPIIEEEPWEDEMSSIEEFEGIKDFKEDFKKEPIRVLDFEPKTLDKITIADLKQLKEIREQEDNLLGVENQRKAFLQKESFIKMAEDKEKREKELKEKIGNEMKEIALGNIKEKETIEEKRRMLNQAIEKVTVKDNFKEKVPTIIELAERKKEKARDEKIALGGIKNVVPSSYELQKKRKELENESQKLKILNKEKNFEERREIFKKNIEKERAEEKTEKNIFEDEEETEKEVSTLSWLEEGTQKNQEEDLFGEDIEILDE